MTHRIYPAGVTGTATALRKTTQISLCLTAGADTPTGAM
jgi:hypothetical protein